MNKKAWLTGPALFVLCVAALFVTWAAMEPSALIHAFDQGGYSPFELATLPVYAAIVPFVWWKCPFGGSRRRRTILCLAVSVVAAMAIAKELDLHIRVLEWFYPDYVSDGSLVHGKLVKPDGRPLTGTPFKMRVLTNGAVPVGMKLAILFYFGAFFGVPAAWAWGCFGGSGVVVQIADRLPAWLDHRFGLDKHAAGGATAASSLCTCLEEGGELMIALFALLTIYLAHRARVREGAS